MTAPDHRCGNCLHWQPDTRWAEEIGLCLFPLPPLPADVQIVHSEMKASEGRECPCWREVEVEHATD